MPRRFPLSAKIVLWFFLNLTLLAALFYGLFRAQFHFGPDWLLSRSANDRIDALSGLIISELAQKPDSQWNQTINRYDTVYHDKVRFLVFGREGRQLAGETMPLPEEIRRRLMGRRGPPRRGRSDAAARGNGRALQIHRWEGRRNCRRRRWCIRTILRDTG